MRERATFCVSYNGMGMNMCDGGREKRLFLKFRESEKERERERERERDRVEKVTGRDPGAKSQLFRTGTEESSAYGDVSLFAASGI